MSCQATTEEISSFASPYFADWCEGRDGRAQMPVFEVRTTECQMTDVWASSTCGCLPDDVHPFKRLLLRLLEKSPVLPTVFAGFRSITDALLIAFQIGRASCRERG